LKLKDKKIAFGLTSSFYAFKNTIEEMKNIIKMGGKIIPIMSKNAYTTDTKYYKAQELIKEIPRITNTEIIYKEEKAEEVEADIVVIAPCSRKPYSKTCLINLRHTGTSGC